VRARVTGVSKRTVVAAAAVFLTLAVLGAGAVMLAKVDDPEIQVNHAVVKEWEQTLAPGLADLSTLDGLPGLDDEGPAELYPCSIDSGELFDLEASRSWTAVVPGKGVDTVDPSVSLETARGFKAMIRRLVAAGWKVTTREDLQGMELPAGLSFDSVDLARDVDGTGLWVAIGVSDDGVFAHLGFDGARKACRLA